MAYTVTTWTNNGGAPLNAENLNKIERGIATCSKSIEDLSNKISEFLKPEDLWENENPKAEFIAQKIELGLSEYKRISILFDYYCDFGEYYEFQHSFKGETIRFSDCRIRDYTYSYSRDVTFLDGGVSFSSGIRRSATTTTEEQNKHMIPIKIIGYKY